MERECIGGSRIYARRKWLVELVLSTSLMSSLVLALPALVRAECPLPEGVPDLTSPLSQASWQHYVLGNVGGDPNFPLVLYLNRLGSAPPAVMMAIDARNGKTTWSLAVDPVIVIAVFANPQTLTCLYYDQGFAEDGQPSGQYGKIDHPDLAFLPVLLNWVLEVQHRVYM